MPAAGITITAQFVCDYGYHCDCKPVHRRAAIFVYLLLLSGKV
jgi:hypothetical protein